VRAPTYFQRLASPKTGAAAAPRLAPPKIPMWPSPTAYDFLDTEERIARPHRAAPERGTIPPSQAAPGSDPLAGTPSTTPRITSAAHKPPTMTASPTAGSAPTPAQVAERAVQANPRRVAPAPAGGERANGGPSPLQTPHASSLPRAASPPPRAWPALDELRAAAIAAARDRSGKRAVEGGQLTDPKPHQGPSSPQSKAPGLGPEPQRQEPQRSEREPDPEIAAPERARVRPAPVFEILPPPPSGASAPMAESMPSRVAARRDAARPTVTIGTLEVRLSAPPPAVTRPAARTLAPRDGGGGRQGVSRALGSFGLGLS
jgi:hypothetical protein